MKTKSLLIMVLLLCSSSAFACEIYSTERSLQFKNDNNNHLNEVITIEIRAELKFTNLDEIKSYAKGIMDQQPDGAGYIELWFHNKVDDDHHSYFRYAPDESKLSFQDESWFGNSFGDGGIYAQFASSDFTKVASRSCQ